MNNINKLKMKIYSLELKMCILSVIPACKYLFCWSVEDWCCDWLNSQASRLLPFSCCLLLSDTSAAAQPIGFTRHRNLLLYTLGWQNVPVYYDGKMCTDSYTEADHNIQKWTFGSLTCNSTTSRYEVINM